MFTVAMLLAGLALLTLGAELLVRGASTLAALAGISPLVIGLTVVAFGTSTPELVVSVQSALRGQADIAVGNVVGSNIFNVLLILGLSALITPLTVAQQLVRFEVPLMIGLSLAVELLALNGYISRWEGLLLVVCLVVYTVWGVVQSRREQEALKQEYAAEYTSPPGGVGRVLMPLVLFAVGLALLVFGSQWFTDAAITIARQLGISELVIGLTIVAAGTSLPEVATSVLAAMRGERDIAVGNVVGSNLFNIMGVLGIASLISSEPVAVPRTALVFDIPVMIAAAVACLPIFFTGHLIARWEGAVFFAYFIIYTSYLIIAESNPEVLRTFGLVLFTFVLPLTVLAVATSVVRSVWATRRQ